MSECQYMMYDFGTLINTDDRTNPGVFDFGTLINTDDRTNPGVSDFGTLINTDDRTNPGVSDFGTLINTDATDLGVYDFRFTINDFRFTMYDSPAVYGWDPIVILPTLDAILPVPPSPRLLVSLSPRLLVSPSPRLLVSLSPLSPSFCYFSIPSLSSIRCCRVSRDSISASICCSVASSVASPLAFRSSSRRVVSSL